MYGIFLIFLHEVIVEWRLKIDLNNSFEKNFVFKFFGTEAATNGPKMKFYKFYKKVFRGSFLYFSHEVTVAQKLPIETNDFLGKNLVLGQKVTKNEFF